MRLFIVILISFLSTGLVSANEYRLSAGLYGSKSTITGGDSAKYTLQNGYGFQVSYWPTAKWQVRADFSRFDHYNDTTADKNFSFSRDKDAATWRFKASRLSLMVNRRVISLAEHIHWDVGVAAGLLIWKEVDAEADTTRDATGSHGETLDFAASEVIIGYGTGLEVNISRRVTLGLSWRADHLTGGGADFSEASLAGRNRWLYNIGASITFAFSRRGDTKVGKWPSDESWRQQSRLKTAPRPSFVSQLDSDNDGIIDEKDDCVNTPRGAIVNDNGCALDSDGDGIYDGLDDCPGTDPRAQGRVDIYGCPVDSDFDGVPDYKDLCPHNEAGALVDGSGCPIDSDSDGIPDGLDDCPNTLPGVDVDPNGCIDLAMLATPMVLNIDYSPGSFEVDPKNKERLKKLVNLLLFVREIRLDINGYTDNIGTAVANQNLSEKRARRVRDFLVANGVEDERIKTFGKGETNFVSSNQTADGRAKNRRIEIIFYK